ncbi:hypothetical protein [Tenacibaculum agarivorans]|uniref:hypothetical protein n=1 Tax=Tenacibaculum agarivorans TaxID=1908389 RepID=UPI00094B8918|nr:hypothetical protein [Tenacibaculum agarivorans]
MRSIFLFVLLSIANINVVSGQQTAKEALQKLAFLTGNWKGTSTSFSDKGEKKVTVEEKVDFLMDGEMLVLNVKSPWIKLHTIIVYSEKSGKYYYYPFTKDGNKKGYEGKYNEGKFLVYFNETTRLTFTKTAKGEFHEFGEKRLENGKWEKYFEDILSPNLTQIKK